MPDTPPPRRVKFTYDDQASFEECSPLTREEYAKDPYRACPKHWRAGTKVIEKGDATHPQIQGCAICGNTKYKTIPYSEYLAYYGNPARHVYLGMIAEEQCPCCKEWHTIDSLWGIDLMDDSAEYRGVNLDEWYTAEQARTLPGYVGELAREMIGHE